MTPFHRLAAGICIAGLTAFTIACSKQTETDVSQAPPAPASPIDAADKTAPDVEWRKHGLNDAEARFSALSDINDGNADELGLAWYFDYPTNRGLEATPLIVDGVIYTTGSWSMVYAHDALTGELKWFYDPGSA